MKPILEQLNNRVSLTEDQMHRAMTLVMEGKASDEDITEFLRLLHEKGETIDEITAAAKVMREKAVSIPSPYGAVDCCGTGGDTKGTYNISTAVALIAAACGVPMVKHGNRSATSKSGAADVLETLGVNLNTDKRNLAYALKHLNYAFFMAPNHHPAMKHVAAARKALSTRTLFNMIGPLANPTGNKLQLIGVYDKALIPVFAEALKRLGTKRACIVHGADGLDEISISGETYAATLDEDGNITEKTLTPDDFGLPIHPIESIIGGEADENAKALRALLEGKKDAYRDIVLANTAIVLTLHEPELFLTDAVHKAAAAIDNGDAYELLKDYIAITRINPDEHEDMKEIDV